MLRQTLDAREAHVLPPRIRGRDRDNRRSNRRGRGRGWRRRRRGRSLWRGYDRRAGESARRLVALRQGGRHVHGTHEGRLVRQAAARAVRQGRPFARVHARTLGVGLDGLDDVDGEVVPRRCTGGTDGESKQQVLHVTVTRVAGTGFPMRWHSGPTPLHGTGRARTSSLTVYLGAPAVVPSG